MPVQPVLLSAEDKGRGEREGRGVKVRAGTLNVETPEWSSPMKKKIRISATDVKQNDSHLKHSAAGLNIKAIQCVKM